MRLFKILLFSLTGLAAIAPDNAAGMDSHPERWWPVQKAPRGLVMTSFALMRPVPGPPGKETPVSLGPEHMLAQSLAGLAAQAVNQGQLDELVWIDIDNEDYHRWREGVVKRLGLEDRGLFTPWELAARYRDKGIVKGYILYSYDYSDGQPTDFRIGSDESVNVASSLAGLIHAVLVEESMEEQARALGLTCLLDARGKTEQWCFENYRDQLNRSYVLTQDPKMPNVRDIAIANRMFVLYGWDEPTPSLYAWLHPLASVLGWNGPDEGRAVEQISRQGHILLPNNWSLNVPVTTAGSETAAIKSFNRIDPATIDWDATRNAVSFLMSDGDNVQWFTGNFCSHPDYWASPQHGAYPIGWGAPLGCLAQCAPEVLQYLQTTQRPRSTMNLHAGGYYYPDRLGVDRPPETRKDILIRHARRLNHFMKQMNCATLMFICMDLDSPEAQEAYGIFAEEIEELTGMFAIQYAPYEAGDGKVFWVKNRIGIEIPVVTCKFAIWAHLKHPRAGTPAKIARLLNESAAIAEEDNPLLGWVITHTWSGFKPIDNDDDDAETATFQEPGTFAAVTPTQWCVDRLKPGMAAVCPEELLWRIRMHHAPDAVKTLIQTKHAASEEQ